MLELNIKINYLSTNCSYTVKADSENYIYTSIDSSIGKWTGERVNFTWENQYTYRSTVRFEIGCETKDGVKCPGPSYVIYGKFKKCQGKRACKHK